MPRFAPRPLTDDEKRIIRPALGKMSDSAVALMIHRRRQLVSDYRTRLKIPPYRPYVKRNAKLKEGISSGPKKYIPCINRCGNWFWSDHKGHRICDACRELNQSVEQYAPIYDIAIPASKARRAGE